MKDDNFGTNHSLCGEAVLAGLRRHMASFHQQNKKSLTEAPGPNGPSEESILASLGNELLILIFPQPAFSEEPTWVSKQFPRNKDRNY